VYSRLDVIVGQSVELFCNVSVGVDVMWTYDTAGPYVQYVYRKGHIAGGKSRLSLKTTGHDFHSLIISDLQLNDSGLYNCYDGIGSRKAGYQLIINGMCWFIYTYTHCVNRTHILNAKGRVLILCRIETPDCQECQKCCSCSYEDINLCLHPHLK